MKLGLVNIHPSSAVIHVFLVSVEFSSTEENFAKTMMMSKALTEICYLLMHLSVDNSFSFSHKKFLFIY